MNARFRTAWARHGASGLPRAALQRAIAVARDRAETARERGFDRRRRIDTAGVVYADTHGFATRYQPVHPRAFREFLTHVPGDRRAMTFVDYGSGRGRALILALEHGFGAALGVEIEPAHHRVAAANLASTLQASIRLVHGDARDVALPPGPVVVFLYNPFPRGVMEEVLNNVRASLRADPRPAWVIYEAPIDRDLLDADPAFELVGERTERAGASPRRPRYAVYRAT